MNHALVASAPPLDAIPPPSRWRRAGGRRGWISIALGAWLFLSIFMWPHTWDAQTNAWLIGVLLIAFGALSLYEPAARWATALIAVWLALSTPAIRHVVRVTAWHDVIVALAVIAASVWPRSRAR